MNPVILHGKIKPVSPATSRTLNVHTGRVVFIRAVMWLVLLVTKFMPPTTRYAINARNQKFVMSAIKSNARKLADPHTIPFLKEK